MPFSPLVGRPELESAKSRLGRSLIRLQSRLEHHREEEARVESLFVAWQKTWSHRRDQITRRLQMIEDQMQQLSEPAEEPPQFAVVGVPPDVHQPKPAPKR